MRVLIAEDDQHSRTILAALLRKWDYQPVLANDGQDAWDIMQKPDAPRLLLLDWMMPKMDGLEVCRRLRAHLQDLPRHIILLSARNEQEDILAGFDAGADDYLGKPYNVSELRARIHVGSRTIALQESLHEQIQKLRDANEQIKTLTGFIPICCHCKKIRNDKGYWERVESYISKHADVEFSHGICPDCIEKYYGMIPKKPTESKTEASQ